MKTLMRFLALLALAALLAACGGGGGCAGTVNGTDTCAAPTPATAPGTTQSAAALTLFITDGAFTPLAQNLISSGPTYYALATVLGDTGAAMPNQIVSFSTDNTVGSLSSAMGLTDASGRAWVRIQPASLTTTGTAILTASSTMGGTTVSSNIGYMTGASNVALQPMTITPATVSALQTAAVNVPVTVNGVAAAPGQVAVTLQPSCGYFTSTTNRSIVVSTTTGGAATANWQSESNCGGLTVTITASASGATSVSGSVAVTAVQPSNILYTGATANTMVVSTAPAGTKQSTLSYKVVDATGAPMASQAVTFTLDAASQSAGVRFTGGLTTTTTTTDTLGVAKAIINSGSLPTPVNVVASLTAVPTMTTSSSNIVVTSGMPSQFRTSLAATQLNLEGRNKDGVTTTITVRTADSMGNPPPANTAVTFTTGYGSIGGSCSTDATGACSVTYTTLGTRPVDGVVTVLAYMTGEESYIDNNGNNVYDAGEPFTDMGQPYRDDNHNGSYDAATEQKIGTATGAVACPSNLLSVTSTCDGAWSPTILVREQLSIGLSSASASITLTGVINGTGFSVVVADGATGSVVGMASGTSVAATVTPPPPPAVASCALVNVSPASVLNQVGPSTHKINLNSSACSGSSVTVTVTSPSGIQSTKTFSIP